MSTATLPHNGTATSAAAAASITPGRRASDERRILDLVAASRWGLTCDQVERRLRLSHQTCSARINGLATAARIFHHGERPTRSGRAARVWFVNREAN